MSQKNTNWLQIIGNVVAIPASLISIIQFFRPSNSESQSFLVDIPAAEFYGWLFALAIFSIIIVNLTWLKRKRLEARIGRIEETIKNLVDILDPAVHLSANPHIQESRLRIGKRLLRSEGLAPPKGANDHDWYKHLSTLLPIVESKGIDRARAEVKLWGLN